MATNTVTRTDSGFTTQAEAERAARTFIWGDVPFSKRVHVSPHTSPDLGYFDHRGCPVIAVSANVNGRLVVFTFDGYGRRDQKPLVLR